MVTSVQHFTEGLILGLTTGHICLATCGPVYSSFLMQQNRSSMRYFTATLEISAGRFITYLLVGAIAGLIGQQVSVTYKEYFTIAAYILFSVFLLISAFRTRKCESGCKLPGWNRFTEYPILLGIITGINVCPSFMLAFSRSFSLSGPVSGMIFFAAFFLGTSVFLIPLSFLGMLGKKKLFRSIARISSVLVAVWFIFSAGRIGYRMLSQIFDTRPIINLLDDTPAYILFDDTILSETCARQLSANKTGKVFITGSFVTDSDSHYHYIITDSLHFLKDSTALRKPNRFTAVLSSRYLSAPDSLDKVISFLRQYSFRFNVKKGDIFFVK